MKCQTITLALLATLTSLASGALLCRNGDGLDKRCAGDPVYRTCDDSDGPNDAKTSGACLGYAAAGNQCSVDQNSHPWRCSCPGGIYLNDFLDQCYKAGGYQVG